MQKKNNIWFKNILSRILYVYSHPVNIQRLRFPPIAAFIPFGGVGTRWGTFSRSVHTTWRFVEGFNSLSISLFLLVSLKHKFTSYISNLEQRLNTFSRIGNLHFGPPPNDPIAALSWDHWTILEVDIRQYSPLNRVPIPPKWTNHNRKSATVLKHMHTSFHTDNKATEKRREHSFHLHYCDQIGWALATGFMDNTEVLPQSVVLFHFSPLCG